MFRSPCHDFLIIQALQKGRLVGVKVGVRHVIYTTKQPKTGLLILLWGVCSLGNSRTDTPENAARRDKLCGGRRFTAFCMRLGESD